MVAFGVRGLNHRLICEVPQGVRVASYHTAAQVVLITLALGNSLSSSSTTAQFVAMSLITFGCFSRYSVIRSSVMSTTFATCAVQNHVSQVLEEHHCHPFPRLHTLCACPDAMTHLGPQFQLRHDRLHHLLFVHLPPLSLLISVFTASSTFLGLNSSTQTAR